MILPLNHPPGSKFTKTIHGDTYPYIDSSKVDLSGRSVFLTGASKGVGKATAISLAKAGCSKIALCARSSLDEVISLMKDAASAVGKPEPQILTFKVDVTNNEDVTRAAKKVEEEFGSLDILLNNAGYLETFTPIADSDVEEWWSTWSINVRGTYLVTRAFLPLLLRSQTSLKTIINTSSIGANNIRPGASAYQTGKLAICRFTEFLCVEYAAQGLVAIAIHPGAVLTDMGKRMPKHAHAILTDKPELAADTVVWLAKERREWLAGRYISSTWDMEELEGMRGEIEGTDKLRMRMVV